MAELAGSLVVGPLLSLVKDKVSSYLLEQYKVMDGMEKQHKILKRKLPAILDIMADAEKQASHREGVKAWLEELKTVAYEANDVFDEFQYEALRRKAKKEGHITKLGIAGVKLFPTHNRIVFRNRMGNKINSIVEAIEVLVAEMNAFGFKHQLEGAAAQKEWRETDHNIIDPENIVSRSRDQERKKIVDMLVNGEAISDGDLMVVPIVGMGGLGKTTLTQLIYNDPQVQDHFQLLKWVCVSDDFNVCNLANKICDASETVVEKALNKLQDKLKGKRYLLVLDDVWNKDKNKWEKLKACLSHGGVGSAILTTTRDKKIAEFMGAIVDSSWTNKYHDVETLGEDFIKEIIERRSGFFSLPKKKKAELGELVDRIAKRCFGSPLAAKALGSVLRNKTTKQEWEEVLQQSSICNNETDILPILKLSYDDLPPNMRQCFAFCALYPKDYQIDVDNLIQLWMANGFISDRKEVASETMGERIIKEMVSRSFFEYVDKNPTSFGYNSSTLLKIHDLMHDVAMSASEKGCVCITNEVVPSSELLSSVARHIHYPEPREQGLAILFDSMRKMSVPIQTLVLGDIDDGHVLQSSKSCSFRAISMPYLSGRDYHLIVQPKHMHHLRYLDLSNSDMEALPDDISILYNLQTLKLSRCRRLRRLPKQMKYMISLRHLYTDGCDELMGMPLELGRLTSLRTVTCFVVGSGLDYSNLSELKDLNISGSIEINRLENVAKPTSAKLANLRKKELKRLSLRWTRGKEDEKQCHEVLEALEAHDELLALEIHSYQGTRFPSWMGMLRNMVELRLSHCMKTEQLPPLSHLPELQLLHLEGLEKLKYLCSMCTPSTFGKLKDLKLVGLDDFNSFFYQVVQGEVVAFPQLEILYIKNCKRLEALPEAHGGADYTTARSAFPSLKILTLDDLCSFKRWEPASLEIKVERKVPVLFPLLETANIRNCQQLTTLPRAPKLRELNVSRAKEDMPTLEWSVIKVDGKEEEKWDGHYMLSSVTRMRLDTSDGFFLQSRALALWSCFGQLEDLTIKKCHELVYWPEKEFQSLVSLRTLTIWDCNGLIGYAAHATDEQPASSSPKEEERSQILPRLESLSIWHCKSLVEILKAPALKWMDIEWCGKLESLSGGIGIGMGTVGNQQQDNKTSSSSLNHHQERTSSTSAVIINENEQSSPSAPQLDTTTTSGNLLASSLETLEIRFCDGLSEVRSLPSSLREVRIYHCAALRVVSGELDALKRLAISWCPELRSLDFFTMDLAALEELYLHSCKSLALCLPTGNGPQAYSSLRCLVITRCQGIKSSLPSALQERLDSLEYKDLDARHEHGQGLLRRLCSKLPSPPRLC